MDAFRKLLYDRVVERLEMLDVMREVQDEELFQVIDAVILASRTDRKCSFEEMIGYRKILYAAFRRLDILSVVLDDEEVTEVMVNGPEDLYVERKGQIAPYEHGFTTPEKLMDVVQMIAAQVNRRVNEASPMTDARLPDGSRVNIVLPPVALNGPIVTIRRFPNEPVSMGQLIEWQSLTREAADFLGLMVECGMNIVVSGGTGSGKTTFLGALAEFIPADERVITIEDSAELRLGNIRNLVRLESRPVNLEGQYAVTIRDLVRNALRMRPDRIVVGEIRGGEALDMLQAMNTGHDGSMSTGHANSAKDMLARIETMCLMAGVELPLPAIRAQIASGVDILVHLGRLRDRSRRVLGIYEVADLRDGEYVLRELFVFKEEAEVNGRIIGGLVRTENPLERMEKLESHGKSL